MIENIPQTVADLATEERQFLHELANPLATAAGLLEAYRDELGRSNTELTEPLSRKLAKLETAMERLGALVARRRARLVALQDVSK